MSRLSRLSRREFLKSSTIAAGLTVIPWRPTYSQGQSAATSYAANEKLNIAGIGVGGRGGGHVEPSLQENLVAVCDTAQAAVDGCLRRVERFYKDQNANKPLPERFSDYRELFDKMGKQIDAVFVATPDHHHAPASLLAIRAGKHVYCEKPLTHDIDEARQMTLAAREHKVATQLGNQGRAEEGWRLLCEIIWAGMIGHVTEVHVWTDRPGIPSRFWWPQGGARPAGADPVPAGLNWDAWLGPAPERPYLDVYKEEVPGQTRLHTVRLARLVGFRHGGPGRYRLPFDQRDLLGVEDRTRCGHVAGQRLRRYDGRNGSQFVDHRLGDP